MIAGKEAQIGPEAVEVESGTGQFPRCIWLGVGGDPCEDTGAAQSAVVSALAAAGFTPTGWRGSQANEHAKTRTVSP